jgi:hypothetical protein
MRGKMRKSQTPKLQIPKKIQGALKAELKVLIFKFFGVWTLGFVICAG